MFLPTLTRRYWAPDAVHCEGRVLLLLLWPRGHLAFGDVEQRLSCVWTPDHFEVCPLPAFWVSALQRARVDFAYVGVACWHPDQLRFWASPETRPGAPPDDLTSTTTLTHNQGERTCTSNLSLPKRARLCCATPCCSDHYTSFGCLPVSADNNAVLESGSDSWCNLTGVMSKIGTPLLEPIVW
jgi:hypothetical protein